MHPARRRLAAALPLLALGPAIAACGDDSGSGRDGAWPPASATVETRGLVWAAGSTIHLGDGSTLDAGAPIRSYVVALGGAYVVPDTGSDDQHWPELVRVDADGTEPLGVRPERGSLATSPDGRYLALLDRSGERDRYDTALAEAVVVDLENGEEVLRSDDGMGDPDTDDLTDLYEDATPYVLGVDDERAWIRTVGDIRSIDLATGDVEVVDVEDGITREPWYAALRTELVADSPDGAWTIRGGELAPSWQAPRLVADDGAAVTTRLSAADVGFGPLQSGPEDLQWFLDSWVDDTHAAGSARISDGGEETWVLVTCAVADGACRVVPGTEDGAVRPEDREVVVPEPLPAP